MATSAYPVTQTAKICSAITHSRKVRLLQHEPEQEVILKYSHIDSNGCVCGYFTLQPPNWEQQLQLDPQSQKYSLSLITNLLKSMKGPVWWVVPVFKPSKGGPISQFKASLTTLQGQDQPGLQQSDSTKINKYIVSE